MLSFSSSSKVFAAVEPSDIHRSFDGSRDPGTTRLNEGPRSGSIFAFTYKRRNLLKILYRDGTNLWVLVNRHERDTLAWPKDTNGR